MSCGCFALDNLVIAAAGVNAVAHDAGEILDYILTSTLGSTDLQVSSKGSCAVFYGNVDRRHQHAWALTIPRHPNVSCIWICRQSPASLAGLCQYSQAACLITHCFVTVAPWLIAAALHL